MVTDNFHSKESDATCNLWALRYNCNAHALQIWTRSLRGSLCSAVQLTDLCMKLSPRLVSDQVSSQLNLLGTGDT